MVNFDFDKRGCTTIYGEMMLGQIEKKEISIHGVFDGTELQNKQRVWRGYWKKLKTRPDEYGEDKIATDEKKKKGKVTTKTGDKL